MERLPEQERSMNNEHTSLNELNRLSWELGPFAGRVLATT
jgi:hypothetical protein